MRIARGTAVLLTYAASLLETFQDEDIRREGNLKSVGFCFPSQSHRRPFDSFLFTLELHNHASFYHTVKKKDVFKPKPSDSPFFRLHPKVAPGPDAGDIHLPRGWRFRRARLLAFATRLGRAVPQYRCVPPDDYRIRQRRGHVGFGVRPQQHRRRHAWQRTRPPKLSPRSRYWMSLQHFDNGVHWRIVSTVDTGYWRPRSIGRPVALAN